MANTTVYPYGVGGSLPTSIGIINDLTTGGADKALSAAAGKSLSDQIGNVPSNKTLQGQINELDNITSQRVVLYTSAWGGSTVSYKTPQDGKIRRFTAMDPSGNLCIAIILMRSDTIRITNLTSNIVTQSYSSGVLTLTLPSNAYWECCLECLNSTHTVNI